MKRNRICGATAVVILVMLLSGCWSRHELNELAIVVGLGIEKAGDGYKVTAQIVNPGEVSTRNGRSGIISPIVAFTQTGTTLPDALTKMTVQSSKRLYFSHLRIVILGEKLAREGISKPLDYISRDPEMRNDFYLVVARDTTPEDILQTFSAVDPIPSNNLYTKLQNSDELWAATGQITLDQLTIDLGESGKNPTLTGLRVIGDLARGKTRDNNMSIAPAAVLEYSGMAAFRNDRMVGWLNEDETKALNYLKNSIDQTSGIIDCEGGGHLSLHVTDSNTSIRIGRNRDMPDVTVIVRVEQNVSDVECKMDMSQLSTLNYIRKEGSDRLKRLLEFGVEYAQQQLGSDIFGFGQEVHRQQPQLWHGIKDWNEVFPKITVRIRPIIIIRKVGSINQSISSQTRK